MIGNGIGSIGLWNRWTSCSFFFSPRHARVVDQSVLCFWCAMPFNRSMSIYKFMHIFRQRCFYILQRFTRVCRWIGMQHIEVFFINSVRGAHFSPCFSDCESLFWRNSVLYVYIFSDFVTHSNCKLQKHKKHIEIDEEFQLFFSFVCFKAYAYDLISREFHHWLHIFLCNTINQLASVCNWATVWESILNLRVQYGMNLSFFCVIHLPEVYILYVHLIIIAIFARRLNVKLCIISSGQVSYTKIQAANLWQKTNPYAYTYFCMLRVSKVTLTIAAATATATERGRRVHTI